LLLWRTAWGHCCICLCLLFLPVLLFLCLSDNGEKGNVYEPGRKMCLLRGKRDRRWIRFYEASGRHGSFYYANSILPSSDPSLLLLRHALYCIARCHQPQAPKAALPRAKHDPSVLYSENPSLSPSLRPFCTTARLGHSFNPAPPLSAHDRTPPPPPPTSHSPSLSLLLLLLPFAQVAPNY